MPKPPTLSGSHLLLQQMELALTYHRGQVGLTAASEQLHFWPDWIRGGLGKKSGAPPPLGESRKQSTHPRGQRSMAVRLKGAGGLGEGGGGWGGNRGRMGALMARHT